jgi:hypothetical protein
MEGRGIGVVQRGVWEVSVGGSSLRAVGCVEAAGSCSRRGRCLLRTRQISCMGEASRVLQGKSSRSLGCAFPFSLGRQEGPVLRAWRLDGSGSWSLVVKGENAPSHAPTGVVQLGSPPARLARPFGVPTMALRGPSCFLLEGDVGVTSR